jgi:hypothetical protein
VRQRYGNGHEVRRIFKSLANAKGCIGFSPAVRILNTTYWGKA